MVQAVARDIEVARATARAIPHRSRVIAGIVRVTRALVRPQAQHFSHPVHDRRHFSSNSEDYPSSTAKPIEAKYRRFLFKRVIVTASRKIVLPRWHTCRRLVTRCIAQKRNRFGSNQRHINSVVPGVPRNVRLMGAINKAVLLMGK